MAGIRKTAPTIETERLRLRAFRARDLKALHALYGNAENLRYWGADPTGSLEETRRAMRWHVAYHPAHYVLWAVENKKSKRLIGMINYHRRDRRERRVDVGWMIEPGHQGKGHMTEAGRALLRYLIDTLKVHKVEALIRPDNKPSIALAKRLGFRLEGGPIRDRWLVGGRWHSVMLYGLIAGEER
jgi:ribosomal-protein-alanine N-acetyltransferase